jgi:hypothetical protein
MSDTRTMSTTVPTDPMLFPLLAFFTAIDERDWIKMRQTLADTVVLDSSPVGRPLRELTADQLVGLSRSISGGFQNTCHHPGNILLQPSGPESQISCDLVAFHYLPLTSLATSCFVLFRKMTARLAQQQDGRWLITAMTTLTEQSEGNPELFGLVQNSPKEPLPAIPGSHEAFLAQYFTSFPAFTCDWKPIYTNDPDILIAAYDRRSIVNPHSSNQKTSGISVSGTASGAAISEAATPGVAIFDCRGDLIRTHLDYPFPADPADPINPAAPLHSTEPT